MKNTVSTPEPANVAALMPARLVFVAPLPDGKEAFAFLAEEGNRPFLVITQGDATQRKENN